MDLSVNICICMFPLGAHSGCDSPLGMENKTIPDTAIKATTVVSTF